MKLTKQSGWAVLCVMNSKGEDVGFCFAEIIQGHILQGIGWCQINMVEYYCKTNASEILILLSEKDTHEEAVNECRNRSTRNKLAYLGEMDLTQEYL